MALIKCPECGKEVSDSAVVCLQCGFPVEKWVKEQKDLLAMEDAAANEAKRYVERVKREKEQEIERQQKTEERKKAIKSLPWFKICLGIFCLLIVIIIAILIRNYSKKNQSYLSALELIENGNYLEAVSVLEGIGSFKDSEFHTKKALGLQAKLYSDNDDFEEAIAVLSKYPEDFADDISELKKKNEEYQRYSELYNNALHYCLLAGDASKSLIKKKADVEKVKSILNEVPDGFKNKEQIIESCDYWMSSIFSDVDICYSHYTEQSTNNMFRITLLFSLGFDSMDEKFTMTVSRSISEKQYIDGQYTDYGDEHFKESFIINEEDVKKENQIEKNGYVWELSPKTYTFDGIDNIYTSLNETTPDLNTFVYEEEISPETEERLKNIEN